MSDPLIIILGIIALTLIAFVAVFWIRSHPVIQAAVDAKLPAAWDERLKALEARLPTKVDVEAEKAKLEADAAPILAQISAGESALAELMKSRGWTVTKAA